MCTKIYIFYLKKQRNKQTKKEYKKAKQTKEEKRISLENRLKKIILRHPGWRFFSSPAFPETRVFSFFGLMLNLVKKKFNKIKYSRSSIDPENFRCGHQQPYNFFSVFADFRALADNSEKPKSVVSKQKN